MQVRGKNIVDEDKYCQHYLVPALLRAIHSCPYAYLCHAHTCLHSCPCTCVHTCLHVHKFVQTMFVHSSVRMPFRIFVHMFAYFSAHMPA